MRYHIILQGIYFVYFTICKETYHFRLDKVKHVNIYHDIHLDVREKGTDLIQSYDE